METKEQNGIDMAEYRKRGTRTFYKRSFQGGKSITTKVVNMLNSSEVAIISDWMCEDSIFGDEPETGVKPCTEEEFNTAKSIAMTRLSLERIE